MAPILVATLARKEEFSLRFLDSIAAVKLNTFMASASAYRDIFSF
jgi:hypothetical protein